MKIGVDFHVIDGKFQGSRTHLLELYSEVVRISPEFEFYFFLDRPDALQKSHANFIAPNIHLVKMPAASAAKRLFWNLPKLIKRFGLDVIHTQYVLPMDVLPPTGRCKKIVTIHDILFETYPQFFTPLFVARSRFLIRWAATRADHIFTVSEYSKDAICRLYGVGDQKVSVTRNGVAYGRFAEGGMDDGNILAARQLSRKGYILSVGRLEPRKNHRTLLEAYALLGENAPPLVIVGQRDFGFDGVFATIKIRNLGAKVRIMEDVRDTELPALYRNAMIFAYPTYAEGFGMPVVEAMAAGVPVVTANTTALPEVCGSSCLLVDPAWPDDIAAALSGLINDPPRRARLGERGSARARQFRWEDAAQVLKDQYLKL